MNIAMNLHQIYIKHFYIGKVVFIILGAVLISICLRISNSSLKTQKVNGKRNIDMTLKKDSLLYGNQDS